MAGHARHSGPFANLPNVLASLAARGYVVASINRRLSGEAVSPAPVLDVKTAIRWLRSKAADCGIDPERAVVWGGWRPERPAVGRRRRSGRQTARRFIDRTIGAVE